MGPILPILDSKKILVFGTKIIILYRDNNIIGGKTEIFIIILQICIVSSIAKICVWKQTCFLYFDEVGIQKSSVFNPILYTLNNKECKKYFKKALFGK